MSPDSSVAVSLLLGLVSAAGCAWVAGGAALRKGLPRWGACLLAVPLATVGGCAALVMTFAALDGTADTGVRAFIMAVGALVLLPFVLTWWRSRRHAANRPSISSTAEASWRQLKADWRRAMEGAAAGWKEARAGRAMKSVSAHRDVTSNGYLFDYLKWDADEPETRHVTFLSYSMHDGDLYLNGLDHDRGFDERTFKAERIESDFTDAYTGEVMSLRSIKRWLYETEPTFVDDVS